tara:strand:- start:79 stop:279 length:201 start_codon:yes stop_codon:yes gene_type:complete
MADIICQKCGYKTNNIEENIERGSTCPICRGELKTKGSKSCGCIILAVIIVSVIIAIGHFVFGIGT